MQAQQKGMNQAKLARLQQNVRIGGKGTARRKRKTVHKTATGDDKKLQQTLKRLGVTNVPQIEEVNMFKDDGTVLHFTNPKVQAAFQSRTCVVTGAPEQKSLQELLPEIIHQIGPDAIPNLKKLAENVQAGRAASSVDDDDIPPLVDAEN
eukprot:CAMPEP_0201495012 /NCGR_PEP_ID=MMETSP0151_2-20130828/51426_1 /ASSEMBLY_ACC=CAM_ASM_000257 /TAXON_ID=200890 /ORGANISM="Paramoeba atlantica, Strain 621/1 / CCAP 1560/9" /LENGTH=149 /DNA_ID=CAMNT_0047883701 /DNA_START=42 /DNA_END=491 /DNA_ORIENTATION=+